MKPKIIDKKLTGKEKKEITENARKYYLGRKKILRKFKNKNMLFGIELENTLLKRKDLTPAKGVGNKIVKKLRNKQIKEEFGSFQIEQNSSKFTLKKGNFIKIYNELKKQKETIRKSAEKKNSYLFATGLTPKFPNKLLKENYVSDEYEVGNNLDPDDLEKPLRFTNRFHEKVYVDNETEIWAMINSMHVHLQGHNADETVKIFNYSQMAMPLITAISANAGYFKSVLNEEDIRMELICGKREKLYGRSQGVVMFYVKKMDDFFRLLFETQPIFKYKKAKKDFLLLDMMDLIETNALFAQIRLENSVKNPVRVEFKTTSMQPTIAENIAVAMFYVLLNYYLIKKKAPLVSIKVVYKDLFKAMKKGINAKIHFAVGKKKVMMPAYKILDILLPELVRLGLKDGLINKKEAAMMLILEDRAINRVTPSVKLRKLIKLEGEKKGLRKFVEYSHNDVVI